MGEMKKALEKWKGKKWGRDEWIILILIGIFFLIVLWPEQKQNKKTDNDVEADITWEKADYKETMEKQLEEVLKSIDGIDSVHVMITLQTGEENVVLKETETMKEITTEQDSAGGNREIVSSKTGEEVCYQDGTSPYVMYTKTPKVEGVLVVVGGEKAGLLRTQIMKAVQALFDIDSHKVVVIKRKES